MDIGPLFRFSVLDWLCVGTLCLVTLAFGISWMRGRRRWPHGDEE
jgi:hypothetical protein